MGQKEEQTRGSVLAFVYQMGRSGNKRGKVFLLLFTEMPKLGTNAGKDKQTRACVEQTHYINHYKLCVGKFLVVNHEL